jgi:hypothetical protein
VLWIAPPARNTAQWRAVARSGSRPSRPVSAALPQAEATRESVAMTPPAAATALSGRDGRAAWRTTVDVKAPNEAAEMR